MLNRASILPRKRPTLSYSNKYAKRHRNSVSFCIFVRVGRIELPSHPWQGRVLPLNHTRFIGNSISENVKNGRGECEAKSRTLVIRTVSARQELSAYSRSTGFPFSRMSTSSKIWENLFESCTKVRLALSRVTEQ